MEGSRFFIIYSTCAGNVFVFVCLIINADKLYGFIFIIQHSYMFLCRNIKSGMVFYEMGESLCGDVITGTCVIICNFESKQIIFIISMISEILCDSKAR